MPCLWNYSILLIHCVISPQCSQTPAWKTPHPIALGSAKREATAPEAKGLPPQDWSVWQKLPTASSGIWLRAPPLGWCWPREGRAVPRLSLPVSPIRWPSCCTAPALNTCCLQMTKRKLSFAMPNSQALPQAAKAATPQHIQNSSLVSAFVLKKTPLPGTKSLHFGSSWDLVGHGASIILRKRHRIWLASGATGSSSVFSSKIFFSWKRYCLLKIFFLFPPGL